MTPREEFIEHWHGIFRDAGLPAVHLDPYLQDGVSLWDDGRLVIAMNLWDTPSTRTFLKGFLQGRLDRGPRSG